MTSKLDFLAQLSLFSGLTESELRDLDQISVEYEFDDGAVIAYQRDVADSLYIVKSGRLYAKQVDGQGIVRESKQFLPNDWFGDQWLFEADAHPYTIKGSGNGRLLIIKSSDFLQFLKQHPDCLEGLEPEFDSLGNLDSGMSTDAWEKATKTPIKADKDSAKVSLLPDELVEFHSRRSKWFLFIQIVGPIILLVFLIALSGMFLIGSDSSFTVTMGEIIAVLALIGIGAVILFRLLDWRNDYFVITNKHAVHREFSLRTFRTSTNKIPVDQIQSVTIERPTFIANLFNFGTARITTASTIGSVYFDNIDDPDKVAEAVNRLRSRVKALDAGRVQATMRQSLEQHFAVEPPYRPIEDDSETSAPSEANIGKATAVARFFDRYRSRVETGSTITYRKHWFTLFKQIGWPLFFVFLAVIVEVILNRMGLIGWLNAIPILFVLGGLAWTVWELEDWRNDVFQLTPQSVIDIDRRPFGFGESRKQAQLSNVQNVNADRPNLWATLFNYGDVYIETAGASSDITFEYVANPNLVQSDIFKRRDQVQQLMRIREGDSRRKEYAVMLDVYKQAIEQNRIPRRTAD